MILAAKTYHRGRHVLQTGVMHRGQTQLPARRIRSSRTRQDNHNSPPWVHSSGKIARTEDNNSNVLFTAAALRVAASGVAIKDFASVDAAKPAEALQRYQSLFLHAEYD